MKSITDDPDVNLPALRELVSSQGFKLLSMIAQSEFGAHRLVETLASKQGDRQDMGIAATVMLAERAAITSLMSAPHNLIRHMEDAQKPKSRPTTERRA